MGSGLLDPVWRREGTREGRGIERDGVALGLGGWAAGGPGQMGQRGGDWLAGLGLGMGPRGRPAGLLSLIAKTEKKNKEEKKRKEVIGEEVGHADNFLGLTKM